MSGTDTLCLLDFGHNLVRYIFKKNKSFTARFPCIASLLSENHIKEFLNKEVNLLFPNVLSATCTAQGPAPGPGPFDGILDNDDDTLKGEKITDK